MIRAPHHLHDENDADDTRDRSARVETDGRMDGRTVVNGATQSFQPSSWLVFLATVTSKFLHAARRSVARRPSYTENINLIISSTEIFE